MFFKLLNKKNLRDKSAIKEYHSAWRAIFTKCSPQNVQSMETTVGPSNWKWATIKTKGHQSGRGVKLL
jgi:hypothetical protein